MPLSDTQMWESRRNLPATWPPACGSSKTTTPVPKGPISICGKNKWLRWLVLYSDRRVRGALGMTCKPNTSPHLVCCLINLINSSFSAPQRRPSKHGRETKRDMTFWSVKPARQMSLFSDSSLKRSTLFQWNHEGECWSYSLFANIPPCLHLQYVDRSNSALRPWKTSLCLVQKGSW